MRAAMRSTSAVLVGLVGLSCAKHAAPAGRAVPLATTPIVCDGELEEPSWRSPLRTGPFVDDRGNAAAPTSEARFLRSGDKLYLGLYAADEDIRSGSDAFAVAFSSDRGRIAFEVSPKGGVRPPIAGMDVGVDTDGTVDDTSDDDEEWVVEAAIPMNALPVGADGALDVELSRCDVPKDGIQRCGRWRGKLALPATSSFGTPPRSPP